MTKISRWRVRLTLTLWDAATGALLVAGAALVLAVLGIWAWAAIEGPWFIAWPVRVAGAFVALVWLGRAFDRHMDRRAAKMPPPPFTLDGPRPYVTPRKRTDETRP